ncbi:hypothetical protein RBH26_13290 [Natronolimnohabitans sp. A-GB9]|uniref:hypothetical protein n=1 Tax=Natronolimnohabitans sp. A-GB9 TaxID=3069757 RepID=UPI0027B1FBEC|nr:hypothetical protein [Natronolimnohabitans sp. A-GB9]MDQ2051452.1 hypothetical protein [Natronolimnohabitans sp. A-GB9]
MSLRYRRRRIVAAVLGTVTALLGGSYAWTQYETRHHLRLWHLELVNESAEAVTLVVTVESDDRTLTHTERLEPATEGETRRQIHDRWMKDAEEWVVRAELGERQLERTAAEITAHLEGSGWGTDCAHVSIVVTEDGDLESRVEPSDVC